MIPTVVSHKQLIKELADLVGVDLDKCIEFSIHVESDSADARRYGLKSVGLVSVTQKHWAKFDNEE